MKNRFKEMTVLIVEDEELNFYYIEAVLRNTNIKLIRAINGLEAVEICEEGKSINLVLMDIAMPKMNCYEATKLIKKRCPDLPIIALTAYSMKESRDEAFEAGCDNYLTKPVSKEQLIEVIEKY